MNLGAISVNYIIFLCNASNNKRNRLLDLISFSIFGPLILYDSLSISHMPNLTHRYCSMLLLRYYITFLLQILMSVYLVSITAVVMPCVTILLEALLASVKLDLLEMDLLVVVSVYDFLDPHLQVALSFKLHSQCLKFAHCNLYHKLWLLNIVPLKSVKKIVVAESRAAAVIMHRCNQFLIYGLLIVCWANLMVLIELLQS